MILAHPLPLFARQGKGADVQIFTPKRRTARSSRRRSRPGPPGSSDLVTNLIDLSRLEAGAARPRPELWTGDDLVGRALETLGPSAERVEVQLPEEPVAAVVDGAQAERVLVNLLENAAKFSSTIDPIEVDVAADNGELVIRVRDHGPGIPPNRAALIFDPFESSNPGAGMGLGLAIATGFAEVNGGRVWIVTAENGGAVVV